MSSLTASEKEELFAEFRNDLRRFAIFFFSGLMEYETADFQKEIYYLLQNKDRVAIAAPRGFTKSTLADVIFPCWLSLLMMKKDICIISASETLAVEFLRKVRIELETNELVRVFFGDVQSDKWTENHIILKNGVNIRAKGAGGQIRGFRPDCLILDDIETDESVENEDQRKKLKDWLFKACLNTLLPGGQMVLVGTLIHPLSVLSDILDTPRSGWEKRKYRAYKDGIEQAGHELWPEARPHAWLQQRKSEIGSWAFAAEFMNDPRMDSTAPIKPEQIRYWEYLPKQYNAVIAVDPAYSEDNKSDWKTASLVLCDSYGNRYLAHYIRTHDAIGDFQDAIINLWLTNRNSVTAIGIPNSGVEKAFFDSFLRKCNERKLYPPVMEVKNSFSQGGTSVSIRNKKSRIIAALQPLFEQGKYYIGSEMEEARDELLTIGSSRWDDIVDTLAYAENIITPYGGNSMVDSNGNNVMMEVAASSDYGYGEARGYESPVDITIGG